jgi:hypothetical protein
VEIVRILQRPAKFLALVDKPIVCIRLRPQKGTRIQKLEDAEGLEVLLPHKEVIQHLMALNAADNNSRYTWEDVPEKPAERKAYWDKINQRRRGNCG